jgi:hypothetical protein
VTAKEASCRLNMQASTAPEIKTETCKYKR